MLDAVRHTDGQLNRLADGDGQRDAVGHGHGHLHADDDRVFVALSAPDADDNPVSGRERQREWVRQRHGELDGELAAHADTDADLVCVWVANCVCDAL